MYEDPPLKADKGLYNGSCNRRTCQKPGATWYNRGSYAYYCSNCARKINNNWNAHNSTPLCIEGEQKEEM